jgi:hypothetical protein
MVGVKYRFKLAVVDGGDGTMDSGDLVCVGGQKGQMGGGRGEREKEGEWKSGHGTISTC